MLSSIGPYRVIDYIGAGGMGTVYRVAHRATGRVAAAKVLNTTAAPRALERFSNEARILQALSHPAISQMYDFLEVNGAPCLVMEYVDGDTLEQLIRARGPLPVGDAIRIFAALADAVSYIHQRGIVHRDLKTNNVKVDILGAVKLLDFGIAVGDSTPRLTSTGNVVGTLMSLAPEQLRTGRAEPRSDIWALGILFYEMLTGRLPFEGGADGFIGEKILRGAYAPASELRPGLPREVDRIIGRCLKVRPDDRYATAEALLTDLRGLQSGEKPAGHLPSLVALGNIGGRDLLRTSGEVATTIARQWRLALSGMVAVAAIVFFAWSLRSPGGEQGQTTGSGTTTIGVGPTERGDVPGVRSAGRDEISLGPEAVTPTEPMRPESLAVQSMAGISATLADSVSRRPLIIRVMEGTADVYINDVRVGTTPYTWRAPVGTEVQLTLRRPGCDDLRRPLRLEEGMQETMESLTGCRRP
ncbi:MAG: serine/threonine protein kinase [Gemmatimonadaceae bacterium]|nr:serine/threonine protein kinase [Gemmatimonadaceae bacterium]